MKKASKQRDNLVKCVTTTAEASIKEAVHRKADSKLKGLVENVDLIAREAWYHESCRKAYTRKEERHTPKYGSKEERTEAESRKSVQSAEEEAHLKAFQHLCKYVEEHIIERAHVIRMTTLTETYCNYMRTHSPQFYNKNYKTYRLKSKLTNYFQSRIRFWQRYAGISYLVYSDEIPTGQAIGAAFENATSEERTVIEAATVIRRAVQDGLNESPRLPWPPGDNDLRSDNVNLPELLTKFLNFLYAKDGKPKSEQCQLRVRSTGQDICYNVSKGKWKTPKHILLGMCVRHLSGNTHLINILNRHGHSVSHSFLLELETAICDSIQTYSGCLPPSIMPDNNLITQFCWDNFDLNEETPSGSGTTHSTHGIVIQEIKEQPYIPQTLPEVDKKKKRSISCANQQLEPCFINPKVEPNILTHTTSLNKSIDFKVEFSDFMWMLARMEINEDNQSIPGWNGWLSNVSHCDEQPSIVDYMEPLSQPITQNSTVQEVLKISQKASRAVGQQFTLITFNLAVAKMAYSLVWQHKQLYSDVIIHLGVFHKFEPDEKVLVLLPMSDNKLVMQLKGPYRICKIQSNVVYVVDIDGRFCPLHVNLLRKYKEREVSCAVSHSPASTDTVGDWPFTEFPLQDPAPQQDRSSDGMDDTMPFCAVACVAAVTEDGGEEFGSQILTPSTEDNRS
ncbi:hypothetical protein ElyMa_003349200 [Elysia marginata]|uniref:Little elongation complex subunit 2 C-terminal domain-containing protein n=1 Tax=Elysia marginata TaxID=1093978 RepID=A0AAV4JHK3_9GAST|nr:hypothetical protein ElyMa_003349200 [Elysia marginata]